MDDAPGRSKRPVLLFGRSGQVGRELMHTLAPLGPITAPGRAETDLTKPEAIRAIIDRVRPSIVVNAAALTNVDQAERDPALAGAVNEIAPGVMAEASRQIGALMVHYSTDYVFDGAQTVPYDERAEPRPLNVYGTTKLGGERRIADADVPNLVIRTSWVYSTTGTGFIATLLRDLPHTTTFRIVSDQIGSPTWSRSLARATADILQGIASEGGPLPPHDWGVYHLAGSGAASRVEIAEAVFDAVFPKDGSRPTIIPVPAAEFGAVAPRPSYSALSNGRAARRFGVTLDPWRHDLTRMLNERMSSSEHFLLARP